MSKLDLAYYTFAAISLSFALYVVALVNGIV